MTNDIYTILQDGAKQVEHFIKFVLYTAEIMMCYMFCCVSYHGSFLYSLWYDYMNTTDLI